MTGDRQTISSSLHGVVRVSLLACLISMALAGCEVVLPTVPREAPTPLPATRDPALRASHLTIGLDVDLERLGPIAGDTGTIAQAWELWHTGLATVDDRGQPLPRIAATLPSLDDGTWQLRSDGTMVTTYQLRSDARWHDGTPLTAEDFVFGFDVLLRLAPKTPDGNAAELIQRVEAPSPHALVVSWRGLSSGANALRGALLPYPRQLFPSGAAGLTADDSYWSERYVGNGPFRVDRLVPGERIELSAFDGYVLGSPRLRTLTMVFGQSRAELLDGLQSGSIEMVLGASWDAAAAIDARAALGQGQGSIAIVLTGLAFARFPSAGGAVDPPSFANLVFRRGLVSALNREQTSFATSLGLAPVPVLWIPTTDPRWAAVAPGVEEVPYNPPAAFQLLADAGWQRSEERRLVNAAGDHLAFGLHADTDLRPLQGIVARYWGEIGAQLDLTSGNAASEPDRAAPHQATVDLMRASLGIGQLAPRLMGASPTIGGAARDANVRELSSYGRLLTALRYEERRDAERDLAQRASAEIPFVVLGFHLQAVPMTSSVEGLRPRSGLDVQPWVAFNAHEWSHRPS